MIRYLVTRHAGAKDFAGRLALAPFVMVEQADAAFLARLAPGDEVYGNLPVEMAAQVCASGAAFHALILPAARDQRGREFTADEMLAQGAAFRRYSVAPQHDKVDPAPVHRRWQVLSRPFLALFGLITAIVVMQNIIANFAYDLVKLLPAPPSAARDDNLVFYLAGIVLALECLLGLVAVTWHLRHRFVQVRVDMQKTPVPCRVLIVGLSSIGEKGNFRATNLERIAQIKTLPFPVAALSSDEFEAAAASLTAAQAASFAGLGLFSWQQALRAIRPHLPRLREVLVISSEQSATDFDLFAEMLQPMLRASGHEVTLRHVTPKGIDFEDFGVVYKTMRAALEHAPKSDSGGDDVCIDVTPGQKIFSIASAVATLNRGVAFGYVNGKGEVKSFDASIEVGAVLG